MYDMTACQICYSMLLFLVFIGATKHIHLITKSFSFVTNTNIIHLSMVNMLYISSIKITEILNQFKTQVERQSECL